MTFEQLKEEANKQGYNLVKKQKYVPLSKCPCGAKLSVKAYDTIYGHAYKCIECGFESYPQKTHKGAREYWNKAVENAQMVIINGNEIKFYHNSNSYVKMPISSNITNYKKGE